AEIDRAAAGRAAFAADGPADDGDGAGVLGERGPGHEGQGRGGYQEAFHLVLRIGSGLGLEKLGKGRGGPRRAWLARGRWAGRPKPTRPGLQRAEAVS